MGKPTNRDKLLTEGLKLIHQRGYMGASVRDIVKAAGVPQGSFTNHFGSKESFALEVLDLYHAGSVAIADRSLRNPELAPLDRLRVYIGENRDRIRGDGVGNGCLYGNLSAEAVDHSERIRSRLEQIYSEAIGAIRDCVAAAIQEGCISAELDPTETASFFVGAFQGAILLAKTQRNFAPIDHFEKILFATILRAAH